MLSPLNHRWRSVRAVLGLIVIGCLAVDAAIAMAAGSNPEHWVSRRQTPGFGVLP